MAWEAALDSERGNVERLISHRDAWKEEAGIWINLCHLNLRRNESMDAEIKKRGLQVWFNENPTSDDIAREEVKITTGEILDESIELERKLFEADAEPYGFNLTRYGCVAPEPWSEYESAETGHRWGGWLASRAASISPAKAFILP